MQRNRTVLAVLLVILATALCAYPSYGQTISFGYNLQCDTNKDPHCPYSGLSVAIAPGQVASDRVTIASVNSAPISGGLLQFTSSPATEGGCDQREYCYAFYDNPGGSASIVGSVFGLPDGSNLLTASFQRGGRSHSDPYRNRYYDGPVSISFVNPVILDKLGLAGSTNYGTGYLSDEFDEYNGIEYFWVSVTFTPAYAVIHNFSGGRDGAGPFSGLTIDQAGNFYGTTWVGSNVFKLTHYGSSWALNPLHKFAGGDDGTNPYSAVIIGADGSLYGTTAEGGSGGCHAEGNPGCGTVFKLTPPPTACKTALCPWTETVLHSFIGGSDGAYSFGNLVSDQAGNLYGTTRYGGIYGNCDGFDGFGCGTVYKLTPSSGGWNETVLWNFGQGSDGTSPYSGVIFDKSGNLYGTTVRGGQYGYGTVFQLTPSGSGWSENILYSFQGGNDGGGPYAGLIIDQSGNLYGATPTGGQGGGGTVLELTPANGSWTFTVLYSFPGIPGTNTGPYGSLAMDKAGSLYGGTVGNYGQGGDYGTIFKLTPSNGGWAYKLLYAFTGGNDGNGSNGNLIFDSSGNLYGTSLNGGAYGWGVVFEIIKN